MMMRNGSSAAIVWLCLLAGCTTTQGPDAHFRGAGSSANVYVAPGARKVAKMAVLPFKAPTELIGQSVSDQFVTELLHAGRCEIVERSQMASVLGENELSLSGLTTGQAAHIGQMMGADAVMTGTVDEYGEQAHRGKTLPVVGITARIIDCSTGKILASVDAAQSASSGATPLSQHSRKIVHEMMAALYAKWR